VYRRSDGISFGRRPPSGSIMEHSHRLTKTLNSAFRTTRSATSA
jgi:hypothetical protein